MKSTVDVSWIENPHRIITMSESQAPVRTKLRRSMFIPVVTNLGPKSTRHPPKKEPVKKRNVPLLHPTHSEITKDGFEVIIAFARSRTINDIQENVIDNVQALKVDSAGYQHLVFLKDGVDIAQTRVKLPRGYRSVEPRGIWGAGPFVCKLTLQWQFVPEERVGTFKKRSKYLDPEVEPVVAR